VILAIKLHPTFVVVKEECYSNYVIKLEVRMCPLKGLNPNPIKHPTPLNPTCIKQQNGKIKYGGFTSKVTSKKYNLMFFFS